jgi:hypothetical protein
MKRRSLEDMQRDANDYARETFRTHQFHLGALDGPTCYKISEAIMRALVMAWAAGYAARAEESNK